LSEDGRFGTLWFDVGSSGLASARCFARQRAAVNGGTIMSRSIPGRCVRSSAVLGLALTLGALNPPEAPGDTEVGGVILEDTVWNTVGSPYIVVEWVEIAGGATLTIEPGVAVRFRNGLGLWVGGWDHGGRGTLVARGTADAPVVFTSNDPFEDPPDLAEPGDWVAVLFTSRAVDAVYDEQGQYVSGSILEYAVVEYAGDGQGGIDVYSSSPYLARCEIRHNANSGIRAEDLIALPFRIEDCHIWGNVVSGELAYGAGIYLAYCDSATLTGNTISGNTLSADFYAYGGAIYLEHCPYATLAGNAISENAATSWGYSDAYAQGAAIYSRYCDDLTVTANTISRNAISGDWVRGGALRLSDCPRARLCGNTISENTASAYDYSGATDYGGGVCLEGSDNVVLTANTISANTVSSSANYGQLYGGGLYVAGCTALTLAGNTISDNIATGGGADQLVHGGGLSVDYCTDLTLVGNTVTGNTADRAAGAIHLRDTDNARLRCNRVTGNHTLYGPTGGIHVTAFTTHLSLAGDPNTGQYNLIAGNDGYQLYNNNSFETSGVNDIDARWVVWCTDDPNAVEQGIYHHSDDSGKAIVHWDPFFEWIPGDLDGDWSVDRSDLVILLLNYGVTGGMSYEDGDLDGDADVDLSDLAVLLRHYGETCSP
jgi:parallel beta-helix repeat protein